MGALPRWCCITRSTAPPARCAAKATWPPCCAGVLRIFNGGWVARSPEADLVFQAFGQLETSVQMQNIAGAAGQFLSGCSVRCASSIRARMARSGKRSALEELRELLAWGTAAGEDLEARVTPERQLVIEARPAPESAAWLVNQAGEVRHRSGRAPLPGETVAGGWARLEGLLLEGDAAPQSVFLEQVVWEDGRLRAH